MYLDHILFFSPPIIISTSLYVCVDPRINCKAINEHRPNNVVSQPGIESGTLWFQDNWETHDAAEATSTSNISVATNFIIAGILLYIKYMLIIITIACRSHQNFVTSSQTEPDIHSVVNIVKV